MLELTKTLEAILIDKVNRTKLISEFQQHIWNSEEVLYSEEIDELLAELAYDLDFYEPNPEWRKQPPNYYGEERLEQILITALAKLAPYFIELKNVVAKFLLEKARNNADAEWDARGYTDQQLQQMLDKK